MANQSDQNIQKLLEQNQKLNEENKMMNDEIKRLNAYMTSIGYIPPMNALIPFSFTFEEYIHQCPVNALKLQEKLFDLRLKGRIICWLAHIANVQAGVSQINLFPCDEQVPFNAILRFTPETLPKGLEQGQQLWIFARLRRNINELELEAVNRPEGLKADLTITYAKIREIFNFKSQIIADQLYKTWTNTQFSLIAQIVNLAEMLEDPNYCAQLNVNVIQPFHDNELEPVVIFIPKQDIADLPSINEHLEGPFEITVTPLARQNNQHWLRFIKLNQILNKNFKPQPLPLNFIPNLFKQQENVDLEQNRQPSPHPSSEQPLQPSPQSYNQPQQFGTERIPQQQQNVQNHQQSKTERVPISQHNNQNHQQFSTERFGIGQISHPTSLPDRISIPNAKSPSGQVSPQTQAPPPPNALLHPAQTQIDSIPLVSRENEVKAHFICELTNVIMTDPVSIKGEHFYERKEIENYVRETGVDPNTQEALTVNEIQAEPQLKASIESYLKEHPERKSAK